MKKILRNLSMTFLLMLLVILSVTPVGVKAEETSQDTTLPKVGTKFIVSCDIDKIDSSYNEAIDGRRTAYVSDDHYEGSDDIDSDSDAVNYIFMITKEAKNGKGEIKLIDVKDKKRNVYIGFTTHMVTYKGKDYIITAIGSKAFSNCKSANIRCYAHTLKKIENRAFYGCNAKGIYINRNGKGFQSIGKEAFANCKNLREMLICIRGGAFDEIGSRAFANCRKLSKFAFPTSFNVKKIGSEAFLNCKKLKEIKFSRSKSLKKIGKNAFKGIYKKCEINVPKSKAKLFKKKGQSSKVKVIPY